MSAHPFHEDQPLTMNDLFTSDFMIRYTEFSSIEEFFFSSGLSVGSQQSFECISREQLDTYVCTVTKFNSWDEMVTEATDEWVLRHLDL